MMEQSNRDSVMELLRECGANYAGEWIRAAMEREKTGEVLEAARAWEKARNGFGRKSREWRVLEEERAHAAERALASGPKLVFVEMKEPFYEDLGLPPLPLPVPESQAGPILQQDRWTFEGLLEGLRYYLLAHPENGDFYHGVVACFAYQVGLHAAPQGHREKADYFFGLAMDAARGDVGMVVDVAYGFMKAGDYEKALREFESARTIFRKSDRFVPDIWLHAASLSFLLGRKIKGRNVLRDYFVRTEDLSTDLRKAVVDYAFKWVEENKSDKEFVEALRGAFQTTIARGANSEQRVRGSQRSMKRTGGALKNEK